MQQTAELAAARQGWGTVGPLKSGRHPSGARKGTENGHDLHIRGLYFGCKNTCTPFMTIVKLESQVFDLILFWLDVTPHFCKTHASMSLASVGFQYWFKSWLHAQLFGCIRSIRHKKHNKRKIYFVTEMKGEQRAAQESAKCNLYQWTRSNRENLMVTDCIKQPWGWTVTPKTTLASSFLEGCSCVAMPPFSLLLTSINSPKGLCNAGGSTLKQKPDDLAFSKSCADLRTTVHSCKQIQLT